MLICLIRLKHFIFNWHFKVVLYVNVLISSLFIALFIINYRYNFVLIMLIKKINCFLYLSLSPFPIKVHELPPEKIKLREVVHIDIANDPVTPADYKVDEDPTKYL